MAYGWANHTDHEEIYKAQHNGADDWRDDEEEIDDDWDREARAYRAAFTTPLDPNPPTCYDCISK